jgi:hypothetical protein
MAYLCTIAATAALLVAAVQDLTRRTSKMGSFSNDYHEDAQAEQPQRYIGTSARPYRKGKDKAPAADAPPANIHPLAAAATAAAPPSPTAAAATPAEIDLGAIEPHAVELGTIEVEVGPG